MYRKQCPIGMHEGITFSSHDALYLAAFDLHKVLGIVADKRMCQIPEIGANHTSYAIGDGLVIVIQDFNDTIIHGDPIAIVCCGLIGIGSTFTAVGVYYITTEGFLYLCSVGIG